MDAGAVTTARTVMRPAHPVQRVTSTSKMRRKRVARSHAASDGSIDGLRDALTTWCGPL